MAEFNHILIFILFGLSGTLIILLSNIFSYRNKIKNKEKYLLVSNLIGFLFLFNSFLYQLYPKITKFITEDIGIRFISPISEFPHFPYYFFIISGILISLLLIKERDFGGRLEIVIDPKGKIQRGILYSSLIFASLAMVLNFDILLIITIFVWIKFMMILS